MGDYDWKNDKLMLAVQIASENDTGNGVTYGQAELRKLLVSFKEDHFFAHAVEIMEGNRCDPAKVRTAFWYFYKHTFYYWAAAAYLSMYEHTFDQVPELIDMPHVKDIARWRLEIGK